MISRDLNFILKVNGMINQDAKDTLVNEVAESYNEAKDNVITRFRALIGSNEAINCKINNVQNKILIIEDKNKKIVQAEIGILKNGSYIEFINKDNIKEGYFVESKIEDDIDYQYADILFCNQTFNYKGLANSLPCILSYESANGIEENNNYIPDYSSSVKMIVQKNQYTDIINRKFRFIFNHSKNEVYEVEDISGVIYDGLYVFYLKRVEYMQEDDLVNNIGYDNNNVNDQSGNTYVIVGDSKLKSGTTKTYSIQPNVNNIVYSIDDLNVSSIQSQNGNNCVLLGKGNTIKDVTLTAKINNIIVAVKYITIYI